MKRDAEAEAADLRLSASGRIGPSQQVNTPTITTTTTDVFGSTPDPVKEAGEKELGIQSEGEFNHEDEDNGLKTRGIPPAINYSAGSKDSHQDHETSENDTYTSNDETTGHERNDNDMITKGDELKEADHLETANKRVPFWRKLIAYRPWKSEPASSSDPERTGIFSCGCDDCIENCLSCCYILFCCCCRHTTRRYWDVPLGDELITSVEYACVDQGLDYEVPVANQLDQAGGGAKIQFGRSGSWAPNPGIKRPPVTILKPPPPPRL